MKRIILLPVFLFVLSAHVNAWEIDTKLPLDKKTSDKIAQKLNRAIAKAAQAHYHTASAPARTAEAQTAVCHLCGENIESPAQHCAATDYTGLCSPAPAPTRTQAPTQESVCPQCGREYTIDETYHGIPHQCTAPAKADCKRSGNGGEPETDPVFVECDEPAQTGGNGGEPATEYFYVAGEEAGQGGNGGEPEGTYYQEVDTHVLQQAKALLQADRAEHGGQAKHTLEYYYKQAAAKAKQK